MSEHRITYITTPVEVAEQIASTLVEEELAVCANIIDHVKSFYRWEGHVEQATEALIIIKAPADKTDELIEKIREIHPYEVPEVLSVDIVAGNPDYLDWLSGKEIEIEDELDLDDEDLEDIDEDVEDEESEDENKETEG